VLGLIGGVIFSVIFGIVALRRSGAVSVFDLRAGDCLNDLEETDSTLSVDATPCSHPHDAEVLGTFDLADRRDWPGEDTVSSIADERCSEMLADATRDEDAAPFVCIAQFERPRRGGLVGG
jgi:hypothetical protein